MKSREGGVLPVSEIQGGALSSSEIQGGALSGSEIQGWWDTPSLCNLRRVGNSQFLKSREGGALPVSAIYGGWGQLYDACVVSSSLCHQLCHACVCVCGGGFYLCHQLCHACVWVCGGGVLLMSPIMSCLCMCVCVGGVLLMSPIISYHAWGGVVYFSLCHQLYYACWGRGCFPPCATNYMMPVGGLGVVHFSLYH